MTREQLQPLWDLLADYDRTEGRKADAGCLRIAMIEIDRRDKQLATARELLLRATSETVLQYGLLRDINGFLETTTEEAVSPIQQYQSKTLPGRSPETA